MWHNLLVWYPQAAVDLTAIRKCNNNKPDYPVSFTSIGVAQVEDIATVDIYG